MIDGAGEGVAAKEPGLPIGTLEEVEGGELDEYPEEDFVFGGGVDAHEGFYSGVFGEYFLLSGG